MDIIYLIEKIWIDSFENEIERAVGYSVLGYTEDEDIAKKVCAKGRSYTREDCWAIGIGKDETLPQFRYKPIKKLDLSSKLLTEKEIEFYETHNIQI